MRPYRHALLLPLALAALVMTDGASFAQNMRGGGPSFSRTQPPPPRPMPPRPDRPRGPGWGGHVHPGIMVAYPPRRPYPPVVYEPIIERRISSPPPRRGNNGAPPAGERRFVPDEVVFGVSNGTPPQAVAALLRRNRVVELDRQSFRLSGTTMMRVRIPDRRPVASVVRALEADRIVLAAQPNYLFRLQEQSDSGAAPGAPSYAATKLRLPLAHSIATGENVLVAVIDSGIDASHPELAGTIVNTFNAHPSAEKADAHGTGIAGVIAGHARVQGAAPAARILAVRAFEGSDGTTFAILKGLDWAADNGARVINMSFAGPADPAIARSLAAARKQGIVLVAATGNAGPKSQPLYPAADPNVIAVTATDADDKLFAQSNRGRYVAVAAPGVDIVAPGLDATYQVASGTSFAAANISGVVALMLQRKPALRPDDIRMTLTASARDLGPKGIDEQFGAGLADAYAALTAGEPLASATPGN